MTATLALSPGVFGNQSKTKSVSNEVRPAPARQMFFDGVDAFSIDVDNLDNNTPLTDAEIYAIVHHQVSVIWSAGDYPHMKGLTEKEDLISEVLHKIYRLSYHKKYTPGGPAKKRYFIKKATSTTLIDLCSRKAEFQDLRYTVPLEVPRNNEGLESSNQADTELSKEVIDRAVDYFTPGSDMVSALNDILQLIPNRWYDVYGSFGKVENLRLDYHNLIHLLASNWDIEELHQLWQFDAELEGEGKTLEEIITDVQNFIIELIREDKLGDNYYWIQSHFWREEKEIPHPPAKPKPSKEIMARCLANTTRPSAKQSIAISNAAKALAID